MLGAFTARLARDEKTSGWIHVRWGETISAVRLEKNSLTAPDVVYKLSGQQIFVNIIFVMEV